MKGEKKKKVGKPKCKKVKKMDYKEQKEKK